MVATTGGVPGPNAARRLLGVAILVVLVAGTVAPASAQEGERPGVDLGVVLPELSCEDLAGREVDGLPGERAWVLRAELVPAGGDRPEHCLVSGTISPQHLFEMRLPTTTWTQRFLQFGCGGFCGQPPAPQELALDGCERYAGGEFAVAYGNAGHVAAGSTDASWAVDRALVEDWAYESEHQLSVVAKDLIELFYGQAPEQSYFMGCSNGGRQALVLAERYPHDFDGIVAGAAANIAVPLVVFSLGWNARANIAADGSQILTPDDLPVLHAAALAACDEEDGLADGVITDPRACDFEPATLLCPTPEGGDDCLTAAEVEAARKIYAGATDERGRRLYPGGMPVGSELAWAPWIVRADPATPGLSEAFASGFLRYLASLEPGASRDLATLEFDAATFEDLTALDSIYSAIDPDLTPFRESGGKLIIWHGWNDPAIPAEGAIAYYEALTGHMGTDVVEDFVRLYLVPGMYHCSGGDGPDEFNLLGPLLEWAEEGAEPGRVVATEADEEGNVVRTRPLFPYPQLAVYDGSGDPDDAGSFVGRPGPEYPDVEWAGEFRSDAQRWCRVEAGRLVCSASRG